MEDYNLLVVSRPDHADLAEEEIRWLVHEKGFVLEHMDRYGSSDMFCVKVIGDQWDLVYRLMKDPDRLVHSAIWIPVDRWIPNDKGQIEIVMEDPTDWVQGERGMMHPRKKNRI